MHEQKKLLQSESLKLKGNAAQAKNRQHLPTFTSEESRRKEERRRKELIRSDWTWKSGSKTECAGNEAKFLCEALRVKLLHRDTVFVWGFCWKKNKVLPAPLRKLYFTGPGDCCAYGHLSTDCQDGVRSQLFLTCNLWQDVTALAYWLKLVRRRN